MIVSASEWAASESIAAEPESRPATNLATAMARLARPAMMTVPTLSLSRWSASRRGGSGSPRQADRGRGLDGRSASPAGHGVTARAVTGVRTRAYGAASVSTRVADPHRAPGQPGDLPAVDATVPDRRADRRDRARLRARPRGPARPRGVPAQVRAGQGRAARAGRAAGDRHRRASSTPSPATGSPAASTRCPTSRWSRTRRPPSASPPGSGSTPAWPPPRRPGWPSCAPPASTSTRRPRSASSRWSPSTRRSSR